MDKTISLQNAFYRVQNMRRADRFYSELLGLKLKFSDGDRWHQYELGGRNFALAGAEEAHADMRGAALVFEVTDLAASEARVVELGGKILVVRDMGKHGKTVILSDPDGNVLHLWARGTPR